MAKVDAIAEQRRRLFEEADQQTNKNVARNLRREATKLTAQMEKAQKEATVSIFNLVNEGLDLYTIDLHGLQTKGATEMLMARIDQLRAYSGSGLTIVTGAGNHSNNGVKIKPLVHQMLREKNISFKEINHGSLLATIP
eukprot:gene13323-15664_t